MLAQGSVVTATGVWSGENVNFKRLFYAYVCVYMHHLSEVPAEARRGHQIPQELELVAAMNPHVRAGN